MKTISKFILASLVIFSVILSSCGKYPDGPAISLRTKTGRLCRIWKDPNSTTSSTTEFKKDGTIASNGNIVSGVTWKFSSDKKYLEETWTSGIFTGTFTAQIMRLTAKDLWLQSTGSSTVDKYTAQ